MLGNLISFNASGVRLISGMGNAVQGNSIHSNDGLGLDLGAGGVTFNDSCDIDAGANDLQNFPVLTSATTTGGNVTIVGTLNSIANSNFRYRVLLKLCL